MPTYHRTRFMILSGLGASLIMVAALVLVFAGPAAAGPQADSMAFLPYVSSPAAPPVDAYETDFTDSIEPWKAVRWQTGASFDVDHNGAGYLDLEVNTKEHYAIVSPLIAGPTAPYNILFRAKLHDRKDKAQFGAIFGADWNGAPCPGDNSDGCFNQYYEVRVRYRDVNGEQYLEYRILRIDGHDENNIEQIKDLVEWTRVEGANADDWNKWEVRYGSRGTIRVRANNLEQVESASDSKYTSSRYFGLYAKAGENGDTDASFDKFSIVKE